MTQTTTAEETAVQLFSELGHARDEIERLSASLDLARTMQEQDRQSFHHLSDKLAEARSRNKALRTHLCDLIEANATLRLALANAQHGDV